MEPRTSAHDSDKVRQTDTTEYVVAEWLITEYIVGEPHIEEDGVDWCAWWAGYGETLD
jgi:hypothetical protein